MNEFEIIKPLIPQTSVLDGNIVSDDFDESDSLLIIPLFNNLGAVSKGAVVRHSLILDTNVLNDILEKRKPENTRFLNKLFKTIPIEINPTYAFIEKSQGRSAAETKDDVYEYSNYLKDEFNWSEALKNADLFFEEIDKEKKSTYSNIELLSGYIPAIIYIYNSNISAKEKLEWLHSLIIHNDLPVFQVHYYFAGLVFLSKEIPDLFGTMNLKKIKKDMKIHHSYENISRSVNNLSNDLAFPYLAPIVGHNKNIDIVVPYIATRDRLMKTLLKSITCDHIEPQPNGRVNLNWSMRKGGILFNHFHDSSAKYIPVPNAPNNSEKIKLKKMRLIAFRESFINLILNVSSTSREY